MNVNTEQLTKQDIGRIVEILNAGGVVAFPTDTVYGLAVRYDSNQAIEKMKQAKHRPETKPFPMMVANKKQIEKVALLDSRAETLIDAWMPGALTLVFKKRPEIDRVVTNGFDTIGIRMPDDEFVLEIINRVGVSLLVPSANLSGQPSCTTSAEVLAQLDGRIDAVVLGESGASTSSTVCDTTQDELVILRQGPISLEDLNKTWRNNKMKIALACDHGGFEYKQILKEKLATQGYEVEDFGCFSEESIDYPDYAYPCALAVSQGRADRGIVICGTGIGVSIVANKVPGIRCALVCDTFSAKVTREHNDSNILAMGGRIISRELMEEITEIWLTTSFSHDQRHQRRIDKIKEVENKTHSK